MRPPVRRLVFQEQGAEGILRDITAMVDEVLTSTGCKLLDVERIGIGFGCVLDTTQGLILKSYQIAGWDNFPLQDWAEK